MKIYDMGRGQGKTTRCILELARNPKAVLLVGNPQMKRQIIQNYKGIENLETRVITVHELKNTEKLDSSNDLIVDELDIVMRTLLGHNVEFATFTSEEKYNK